MGKRRIPEIASTEHVRSLLAKPIEDKLDLHNRDAAGAESQLQMFLERLARMRPGIVVRVITGRGNRSEGAPVLQPLVKKQGGPATPDLRLRREMVLLRVVRNRRRLAPFPARSGG